MSLLLTNFRGTVADPQNTFRYSLAGHWLDCGLMVRELAGVATVPPRSQIGIACWVRVSGDGPDPAQPWCLLNPTLEVLPPWQPSTYPVSSVIGAWGTRDFDAIVNGTLVVPATALMPQQQTADGLVKFGYDAEDFVTSPEDPSLDLYDFTTNAQSVLCDASRVIPQGLACEIYVRTEAARTISTGLAQCNLASGPFSDYYAARTQGKGRSGVWNNFEACHDWQGCPINPGTSEFYTYVNGENRGRIMVSGYRIAGGKLPIGSAPVSSPTALLLHLSTDMVDSSPYAHPVTNTSAVIVPLPAVFGGGSAYFNGSAYLTIPDHPRLRFGTNPFGIDAWVYRIGNNTSQMLFSKGDANQAGALEIFVWTDNKVYCQTANANFCVSSVPLPANTFTHVAAVREPGNAFKLYFNGEVVGTGTLPANLNATAPLYIGRRNLATQFLLHGYVNEYRITNGVAPWTAPFAPPSQPY